MNAAPASSKMADLFERLRGLRAVVVAYSGGVDSAVLAVAAHRALGENALAVTAVSPAISRRERQGAEDLARRLGFNHLLIETHELRRDEYVRNDRDRCYWCKTELFEVLRPIAARRGARIAVGTNLDDLADYRPGRRAAREQDVLAPLAEAGFTKAGIRSLAAAWGLPVADKPASPCLASRFAYGVKVTSEGLERIDAAEEVLRELGFDVLRVRDHGDLARIEVPPADVARVAQLRETIATRLRALGFLYVTVDLSGFRSGSLNEVLLRPTMRTRRPPAEL